MTEHGLGRVPHIETPDARMAYPVTARPDYRRSTQVRHYWYEGGVWLDQGQTGTCVGNAFAHRWADGPVDHGGITEDWAINLYVEASGDKTLQEGTSALAACRVLKAAGNISAYHWVGSADELRNAVLERSHSSSWRIGSMASLNKAARRSELLLGVSLGNRQLVPFQR